VSYVKAFFHPIPISKYTDAHARKFTNVNCAINVSQNKECLLYIDVRTLVKNRTYVIYTVNVSHRREI